MDLDAFAKILHKNRAEYFQNMVTKPKTAQFHSRICSKTPQNCNIPKAETELYGKGKQIKIKKICPIGGSNS